LDLSAVIARCAIQLQLSIGQLVGIKFQLRFGNFKIVSGFSWRCGIFRRFGLGSGCWGQTTYERLVFLDELLKLLDPL
jgi:hypothetical protein